MVSFLPLFGQTGKVYRQLAMLDYLAFVGEADQKTIKGTIKTSYREGKGFATALGEEGVSLDHRYFVVHPRRWMDFGGPELLLDQIKAAFRARGLSFDWRYTIDDVEAGKVIFQVRVNEREYRIIQGKLSNRRVHLVNQAQLYSMVQEELVRQGSTDRLYALGKGEASVFMILSPEQYTYIFHTFYRHEALSPQEKPWLLGTWAEVMGLVPPE